MLLRLILACVVAAAITGCSSRPPPGFLSPCRTTADCQSELQCLPKPASLRGGGRKAAGAALVCSLPCTSADDCPTVTTSHCGDLTICTAGVCDYLGCL